ncbi:MAG TPA: hypothetical protein VFD92_24045 [Candidatus Binatia bacterium]|nr:hypothetical protein [Candidatus Binatia bacterium]
MAFTARVLLHASLALLATATWARAGTILASGPLKIAANDSYSCTAVNVGASDLAQVQVDVTVVGSNTGSGFKKTCSPLAANGACEGSNQAGATQYRFCTVGVVGNRKNVRAAFCNTSTGDCLPLQ